MPKISIIIPVYNLQNFIAQTIDSVLNQTFGDYELIVVDDGSCDDSLKILENYPQIILYKLSHTGAGSARNYALKKAKGEYILFLDGDDIISKNCLKKMHEAIVQNNADVVVCSSGEFSKNFLKIEKIHDNNPYPQGWAWDKLVKREFIEKFGLKFSSFNSSEDFLFSYGACFLAEKIVYLEDCLVFHRNRKNSLSQNRSTKNIFLAAKELKELLVNKNVFEDKIDDFRNILLKSFIWHYLNFKNIYKKYLVYKLIKKYEAEFNILNLKELKYKRYFNIYQKMICSKNYFIFLLNYMRMTFKCN